MARRRKAEREALGEEGFDLNVGVRRGEDGRVEKVVLDFGIGVRRLELTVATARSLIEVLEAALGEVEQ